jgi:hypothetical protein
MTTGASLLPNLLSLPRVKKIPWWGHLWLVYVTCAFTIDQDAFEGGIELVS